MKFTPACPVSVNICNLLFLLIFFNCSARTTNSKASATEDTENAEEKRFVVPCVLCGKRDFKVLIVALSSYDTFFKTIRKAPGRLQADCAYSPCYVLTLVVGHPTMGRQTSPVNFHETTSQPAGCQPTSFTLRRGSGAWRRNHHYAPRQTGRKNYSRRGWPKTDTSTKNHTQPHAGAHAQGLSPGRPSALARPIA